MDDVYRGQFLPYRHACNFIRHKCRPGPGVCGTNLPKYREQGCWVGIIKISPLVSERPDCAPYSVLHTPLGHTRTNGFACLPFLCRVYGVYVALSFHEPYHSEIEYGGRIYADNYSRSSALRRACRTQMNQLKEASISILAYLKHEQLSATKR